MKIDSLQTFNIEKEYQDLDVIIMLESHLTYLRSISSIIDFPQTFTVKYVGDFYGLLQELGYQSNDFYIIMQVNDMKSPSDYKGTQNYFYLPPMAEVERLVTIETTKKIY